MRKMARLTVLWVLVAALLCTQVQGWGGFKSIGEHISRGASHVSQQVSAGVATVHREIERVGDQIATVVSKAAEDTEKFGQTVGNQVVDVIKPLIPVEVEESTVPREGPQIDPPTKCWPLGGVTVDFECRLAGNVVNCRQPMEVGTIAAVKCKPAYKLPEDYVGHTSITCNESYQWSDTVRRCLPDCGRRNVDAERANRGPPLIDVRLADNRPAVVGESPWHVGIYKAADASGGGGYSQVCSGTLITSRLVLTAAVCFWNLAVNNKYDNFAAYKVFAGKHYRDWDHEEVGQQSRGVEHVYMHERFWHKTRTSAYNVALVKVTENFQLTPSVNTVCVDWHNVPDESRLAASEDGIVGSWSEPDTSTTSEVNSPVHLKFLEFLECGDVIDEEEQSYLTGDKVCGRLTHGKATFVCPADTGVGFVFPLDTVRGPRYYLRSLSSGLFNDTYVTEGRCAEQNVALFTQFHVYNKWVQKIVTQN